MGSRTGEDRILAAFVTKDVPKDRDPRIAHGFESMWPHQLERKMIAIVA